MKVEWKSPIKCAKELRVEEVVVEIDSFSLLGKMFSKFDRFVTSYNYYRVQCRIKKHQLIFLLSKSLSGIHCVTPEFEFELFMILTMVFTGLTFL